MVSVRSLPVNHDRVRLTHGWIGLFV
uniref:Uncharacterized protein n=1 Tax=Romanomermis culicivorax TaxID=13658 RepID=A0A915HT87_ROMCU